MRVFAEGELHKKLNYLCETCPINQYNFQKKFKILQTLSLEAKCQGDNTMELDSGYWRSYNLSDKIFMCN